MRLKTLTNSEKWMDFVLEKFIHFWKDSSVQEIGLFHYFSNNFFNLSRNLGRNVKKQNLICFGSFKMFYFFKFQLKS